ncbi:NmrA family NAD(P)-binding protein [Mesorhizobium sp.]|uniref:SDR family oxidoreductase n=1 Tax=Mesorhizobium sp. TaxID=1871066 RepID=UPI00120A1BBF|nr:NmrA family NAD(P)-binding protein [Mesorhizobium sp.]TIS59263.1 MAG: NAD-dependent epimerase/dehydratase family protein [Mesorhizobium sp.]TIS86362.1 MAG: NAD-dependent epimerase/dehydratase family protein [Mesorhizobium sp.]
MTILAIGAAGAVAGLVVPALAERGARVRGLVRKPEQVDQVRGCGAAEVTVGDLRDRTSLDQVFRDIDAVFYIAPAFLPGEAEVGKGVVDAAIRAGVRRFVFSSVIHPVLSGLVNHAAKAVVEEAVLNSTLEYTFLHPTLYFQNYAGLWSTIIKTGVLAEPWSADTRFTRVDYRDVAEAAAIALTEDRLLYGTFELCSAGNLNRKEVAALIGEVLGREIRAETSDPAALGDIPKPMRTMFEHYEHRGLLGSPLTLRAILGREPRTLRAYIKELAAGKA